LTTSDSTIAPTPRDVACSFDTDFVYESEDVDIYKDGEAPDYGSPQFWHEVYTGVSKWQRTIPAEWLLGYPEFKAQGWHRYLRGGNILELGCGNCDFMSAAYDDGFHDVTCTDIDHSVVNTMRQRNSVLRPGIKYMQCDACDMHDVANESFDIIFDKSTMDALICAGKQMVSRCSAEVHRVLKDAGMYICLSHNEPGEMKSAIEYTGHAERRWRVKVLMCVPQPSDMGSTINQQPVYMYACQKADIVKKAGLVSKRRHSLSS